MLLSGHYNDSHRAPYRATLKQPAESPRLEMLEMESKDIEEDEAISQYIISFTLARSPLSYILSLSFAQRDLDRRPKLP